MRALLLLELAFAKNNLLVLSRSPLRLILWSLYIGILLVGVFLRVRAAAHHSIASAFLSAGLASAFGGVYLAAFGGSVAYHALGNIKAFRSRAEALFFSNAGLSARVITMWLQFCRLLSLMTRWIWTIALNFIIFSPNDVSGNELMRGFAASIAGAALLIALELPAFLLGKKKFGVLLIIGGVITAIIGVSCMLLGLASADGNGMSKAVLTSLPCDSGVMVLMLLHGSPIVLTVFLLLPLIVCLTLVPLAADAVPELYAASLHSFEVFKRNRSATLGAVFEHDGKWREQGWVPAGAFVLLWKEWSGFRRRRLAWLLWSVMLGLAIGTSLCMVGLARYTHHEADGWSLLGLIGAFVFLVPLFASIGLADDVGKPLFWMTMRSLRAHLLLWTCARSWRGAVVVGVALLIAAMGMGDRGAALLLPPAAVILWFSLNAMGVLIYALFPNRFDEHGPLFFVRLLAAMMLLTPCVVVSMIAALHKQSAESVVMCVCLTLLVEAFASLEMAGLRLRYNSGA
jgi:hypothetical protein